MKLLMTGNNDANKPEAERQDLQNQNLNKEEHFGVGNVPFI